MIGKSIAKRVGMPASGIRSMLSKHGHSVSCLQAIAVLLILLIPTTLQAQVDYVNMQQFEDALRKPFKIRTQKGQLFEGVPVRTEGDMIVFKSFSGVGEIELPLRREDISDLAIPGSEYKQTIKDLVENGRYEEALTLLKPLYAQRVRFFSILPEEAEFFVLAVDANIAIGKPLDAVAVAKVLKPHISDKSLVRKLDEAIIIGHYKDPLTLYEESRQLAEVWLADAERFDTSALGWWIVSQIDYEEEKYLEARRMAMKPIVFSGQLSVRYLQHCYAVAAAAAVAMDDAEHARLLINEMQERGLTWPVIEKLPNVPEVLAELDAQAAAEAEAESALNKK